MKLMPFSDFYLIFKLIFYEFFSILKSQKGFTNLQADVARGTASRCDAALRPRGRARVARVTRKWRWRVARGHADGSTWAPVWGATWQAGKWRAHGNSGTLVSYWGR